MNWVAEVTRPRPEDDWAISIRYYETPVPSVQLFLFIDTNKHEHSRTPGPPDSKCILGRLLLFQLDSVGHSSLEISYLWDLDVSKDHP